MRWFVRGDIDGFFGLALDNLIQLLLISGLCLFVLEMPGELVTGRIMPGVILSMIIGNVFYAWQAKKLAEKEGRDDVCALPYGLNTPAIFVYVFLVMLPVKYMALGNGLTPAEAAVEAWRAGLVACLGSGVIEFGGAFVAERIRQATPRAAQLATLSGIALGFISMPFFFRTFAEPMVGFTTLAIIALIYFGQRKFLGGVPGGLVAVVLGTALCWATGVAPGPRPTGGLSLNLPLPYIGDLLAAFQSRYFTAYFAVILPMGLFNVLGSLQNIESAEAAGDRYDTRSALAVNGIGTLAAAIFGSCFPTTIYIGHPGWKGLGARAGYSILNAIFVTVICLIGAVGWIAYAVPIEAGMAIVLWIGIVITAQTFQATPRTHAPAAVVGIMIGVGAWAAILIKTAMRVTAEVATGAATTAAQATALAADPGADVSGVSAPPVLGAWSEHQDAFVAAFARADLSVPGLFAIEQGFILTAMIFAAVIVHVIEGQFRRAAAWCGVAAVLAAVGLLHSHAWGFADVTLAPNETLPYLLAPAWPWVYAYLICAAILLAAPYITRPNKPPAL